MLGGITNSGLQLLSQAIGGDKLQFTLMKLGSDYPTPTEDYKQFVTVQEPKVEIPVNRTCWVGSNKVQSSAHLLLKNLTSAFTLHEVGLYATLTTKTGVQRPPVLYAYYYQEVGETLSPDTLIERTFCIETHLDHASEIQVVVDTSVEFITHNQFHEHTQDTQNPHRVTAYHIGLEHVYNEQQATSKEVSEYLEGKTIHKLKYLNVGEGANLCTLLIQDHEAKSNPHGITKETIGLGEVHNYPVATLSDAETLSNDKYMTPMTTQHLLQYQVSTALLLLQNFTDYHKLLQKDKLIAGPNMAIVPTEDGLKVTYIGATNPSTYSWNNIVEGNFEGHPDVQAALSKYIKTLTSTDNSVKIEKVEGGYNLTVAFKPTFQEIQGNPLDNKLLERLLNTKLEASSITASEDFVISRTSGEVEISLTAEAKQTNWEAIKGDIKLNPTLKSYIEELSLQKSEIATLIRGGTGIVVTVAPDGALVINSTGTGGSVDLSAYLTKQEAEQTYAKKGEAGGGGSGPVDLSNYYTKQEVDQRLESKLGLLEDYPQLATQNKTVIGAVAELDSRLDSAAVLIQNQDKEIEDLKKYSVDYKNQTVKAINSKANSSLTIESTTKEVVGVINALELGTGFVPPEYNVVAIRTTNTKPSSNYLCEVRTTGLPSIIWEWLGEFNWKYIRDFEPPTGFTFKGISDAGILVSCSYDKLLLMDVNTGEERFIDIVGPKAQQYGWLNLTGARFYYMTGTEYAPGSQVNYVDTATGEITPTNVMAAYTNIAGFNDSMTIAQYGKSYVKDGKTITEFPGNKGEHFVLDGQYFMFENNVGLYKVTHDMSAKTISYSLIQSAKTYKVSNHYVWVAIENPDKTYEVKMFDSKGEMVNSTNNLVQSTLTLCGKDHCKLHNGGMMHKDGIYYPPTSFADSNTTVHKAFSENGKLLSLTTSTVSNTYCRYTFDGGKWVASSNRFVSSSKPVISTCGEYMWANIDNVPGIYKIDTLELIGNMTSCTRVGPGAEYAEYNGIWGRTGNTFSQLHSTLTSLSWDFKYWNNNSNKLHIFQDGELINTDIPIQLNTSIPVTHDCCYQSNDGKLMQIVNGKLVELVNRRKDFATILDKDTCAISMDWTTSSSGLTADRVTNYLGSPDGTQLVQVLDSSMNNYGLFVSRMYKLKSGMLVGNYNAVLIPKALS